MAGVGAVAAAALVVAFPVAAPAGVAQEPPPDPPLEDTVPAPPLALSPPRIEGRAYKRQILVCTPGGWDGATPGFTWQWFRDGVPRAGSTTPRYRIAGDDVGHALVCTVAASNEFGWNAEDSAPVVASTVPVVIRVESERRQHGPTLRVEGRVLSTGPPAEGSVVFLRDDEPIGRAPLGKHGGFAFEESVWRLTPGRADVELRFLPRDPELHAVAQATVRLAISTPPTYPFPRSPLERPVTVFDDLSPFWLGGGSCASGCRPAGARAGWPLEPFDEQHGLRAGINERRDSGFHLGVDIQARAGAPVYAIQPGRAHVIQRSGSEARVQIGNFVYWHLKLFVEEGDRVAAFDKPIGLVFKRHRHLHLSEVDTSGRYLNPLRPGGRVLEPWDDHEPPVVGRPVVEGDGSLVVEAFDPQSYEERTSYTTPVLAPSAVAWRLFDRAGRPLTALRWKLRGTHVLSDELISSVYTTDARRPGFACFAVEPICVPNWRYRLAWPGELRAAAGARRVRLTVYAWDWQGNTTARDVWLDYSR